MSVVIIGGNERMERRYKELCGEYNCKAKIYTKLNTEMKNVGKPDLLVLFTATLSHKMLRLALSTANVSYTQIIRCHTSSISALKKILDAHCGRQKA